MSDLSGIVANQTQSLEVAQYAIFDRVINVRFLRRDRSTSFCLRSDYEVSLDAKGNYFFHKVIQKPTIKLEYKRVSTNVGISLKLHITNFHIKASPNSASTLDSPTAQDNPIERVIIQLGYFNQFPKFTDPNSLLTLDDYYNMTSKSAMRLYEEMDCQVLAIYPTQLPPDGVTTFDCVVGFFDEAFHSRQDDSDTSVQFNGDTTIEDFFFQTITRRYAKKEVPDILMNTEPALGGKVKLVGDDEIEIEYSGPLTPSAAEKYGVKCYVSDMLKTVGFKDASGRTPNVIPAIPQLSSVNAAFDYIQTIFPNMRFMAMTTGDYIVYHKNDSPDEIGDMLIEQGVNAQKSGIPAIYSITYAGLRTIQCPFTTLVRPFQKLSFQSRYNIANMIGYFYRPKKGEEVFFVINFAVTFSTTGDENMMEITSTDSKEEQQA